MSSEDLDQVAGPATRPPAGRPIIVTVVHAPACHFCDDAESLLARLAESYPLDIRRVDIRSDEGRRLVAEHRPPMSPLVLVDGRFFGFGRLSRGKLRRLLDRGPAGTVAS